MNYKEFQQSLAILGGKMMGALKPMAAKLGVASSHLYVILVRQAFIKGITNLIVFGFVGLFFAAIAAFFGRYAYKHPTQDGTNWFFCLMFSFVACVVLSLAISINLPAVLNPQYAALHDLVCTLSACQ